MKKCILIITGCIILIILLCQKIIVINLKIINWEAISAIVLAVTAFFIAKQALATKKLTDKTMLPMVDVGLIKDDITRVSIRNLSSFPIWIWLDIELFNNEDYKPEEKLEETLSYSRGLLIGPGRRYTFPRKEVDSIIEKHNNEKIYARINYWCNINSRRPESDVKPTKIIFRYDYYETTKTWLIQDVGMPFIPL